MMEVLLLQACLLFCVLLAFSSNASAQASKPSPCSGPACPSTYPQPGNCPSAGSAGRDNSFNIIAGRDFTVNSGAEGEGRIYVGRNLNLQNGFYNLIAVGAGSCVVPQNGLDGLLVGGNLNIAAGATAALDGLSIITNAKIGGSRTGTGNLTTLGTVSYGAVVTSPVDFAALNTNSAYWTSLPNTGTTTNQFGTVTFSGNNSSSLQVFTLNGSVNNATIDITNIPANATVLINVPTSGTVTIHTNNFTQNGGEFSTALTRRVLWNFTNATQVNIAGFSQFRGSIVVPNGSMTHSVPGLNGRVIVGVDLVQNGALQ
jgi:choice-of-anchor A domain-containing protein